jgi:hypothetical protein
MRRVNELSVKGNYECVVSLRTRIRCLPTLIKVSSSNVVDAPFHISWLCWQQANSEVARAFTILNMGLHNVQWTLQMSYLPNTTTKPNWNGVRRSSWNHKRCREVGIINFRRFFLCHHPTLWTFMKGITKDTLVQRMAFPQSIFGSQPSTQSQVTLTWKF